MSERTRAADAAGARVLLVDDEANQRVDLHRVLSAQFMVQAFADGAEALAAAREMRPDLVLSDVIRPGMDGLALVRALRADPATRAIPIILLSARSGEGAAVAGLEAGADDYLVKPFRARELLARVTTRIIHARLRGQLAAANERQRLARELHDSLSQTLVGADLIVTSLLTRSQTRSEAASAPRDIRVLEELSAIMRTAIAETRVLSTEVHPETLGEQPLGNLIERLAELVRSRLPMDILFERQDLDPRPVPTDVQHAYYRIAQECLFNVMKHAAATKLTIFLQDNPRVVTMRIRDNGCGFDPAACTGPGVRTMRERAASIGAELYITSAPGEGTEVVALWSRM